MLEVLSPASQNLLTLLEVKGLLKISGVASDADLQVQIEAASGAISAYCRRTFKPETVKQTFFETGTNTIALARWPVISVTSFVEGDTTLGSADYALEVRTGLAHRLSGGQRAFWSGKVEATYVAGYNIVPMQVKVAMALAIRAMRESSEREVGIKSERFEGFAQMSYFNLNAQGLPSEVTGLLEEFVDTRS